MTKQSNMGQPLILKRAEMNALSLLFKALSNKHRLKILNILRNGPKNVGEIADSLDAEQTVVSHNLKCLTFCGLVTARRDGKTRVYALNHDTLEPILRLADRH